MQEEAKGSIQTVYLKNLNEKVKPDGKASAKLRNESCAVSFLLQLWADLGYIDQKEYQDEGPGLCVFPRPSECGESNRGIEGVCPHGERSGKCLRGIALSPHSMPKWLVRTPILSRCIVAHSTSRFVRLVEPNERIKFNNSGLAIFSDKKPSSTGLWARCSLSSQALDI